MFLRNKKILATATMLILLIIFAYPAESFASDSVSTSMSGGGTYQVGDKITVRFSFTGPEEGKLAGVVSRLSFNSDVLRYESMRSSSNTTILEPGVYEGITIHDLTDAASINRQEGFTSGIYNDDGVTTLSAAVTFEVISPGDTSVAVRSTHAGNVSLERLGNSSASLSISAEAASGNDESEEEQEDSGDDGNGSKSEDESGSSSEDESSDETSSGEGSNSDSRGSEETGEASQEDQDSNNGDANEDSSGSGENDQEDPKEEGSGATESTEYFKQLAVKDIREEGWFVLEDLSGVDLEPGFEIREIEYEEERVHSAFHEIKGITLLYFTDVSGEETRKYIYVEEEDELYPYVTITQGMSYTFLPGMPEEGIPEGYEETQVVVEGQVLRAWQLQDESKADFYLVHGVNEEGEKGLYQYDQKEGTMQRFIPEEKEAQQEEEPGFLEMLQENRRLQGAFISLGIVILILIGALGILSYKLNQEKQKRQKRKSSQ